jgi:hypothetical protein
MSNGNIHADVVANHGEDLRFPISSSSGFSSPFSFPLVYLFLPMRKGQVNVKDPCRSYAAGFFLFFPFEILLNND